MSTLYQYGTAGATPDHIEFFKFPPVSLKEMREWIEDGAGNDAIGLGAVVNDKGEILGELVMPGGKDAYMVNNSGKPELLGEDAKIIFAQVGYMPPDQERFTLKYVKDTDDLKQKLKAALRLQGKNDGAFMVRLSGDFPEITYRTVEAKEQKVETLQALLTEPVKQEKILKNCSSKLVGVYSANDAITINTTFDEVLHLHGVSEDNQQGGHVSGFKGPLNLSVELMPIDHWLATTKEQAERQCSKNKQKPTILDQNFWQDMVASQSTAYLAM